MAQNEVSLYATGVSSADLVEHAIASLLRFVGPDSQKVDPDEVKAARALLDAVALREALVDDDGEGDEADNPLDDLYRDAGNREDEDELEPELDN